MKEKSNKLSGKDLMNVGIFTALNLVIGILIACTIGLIPIGFMLITTISPLILGIPMMLYYTRIKKFGMLLIMYIVNGVVMILTGMGADALIFGTVFALIGELILKSGNYQSANRAVLSFAVCGLSSFSNYIHWIGASEEWLAKNAPTYGEAFMTTIANNFSYWWMLPVLMVSSFAAGIIGGLFGKKVLKKHFAKSGLL